MMTLTIQRCLSAAVLAVWGVLLVYFFASGRIGDYLHPGFHPATIASGIVLLALSAIMLFAAPEDCACCTGGKQRGVWPFVTAAVLTAPVLSAVALSPSQFGTTAVANRGVVESLDSLPGYLPPVEPPLPGQSDSTPRDPVTALPVTNDGKLRAETVDLLYAAQDSGMRADFENKTVEMIGQWMPARENNPNGDRHSLVRMFVMCCAADARPVAVAVQTKQNPNLPEMGWVRVTGKATFPFEGGRNIPVIEADAVATAEPPAESFIY